MNSFAKTLGTVFIIALIVGTIVAVYLINQGKFDLTQEKDTFNIKIINVDNELEPQMIIDLADQYAQSAGDFVVNATPLNVDRNQISAQLGTILSGADAVVFPSITNDLFRTQMDSLYPVSATNTYSLPVSLNSAYSANEPGNFWALPLLIDPVVMVINKDVEGATGKRLPKQWSDFFTISELLKQTNTGLPHFLFVNNNSTSLSDAIAARVLQTGYEDHSFQNPAQPRPPYFEEQYQVLQRSIDQFKLFMKDEPDAEIKEIPQVTSLEAFIESNAFFTYVRYSDFAALPEDQQNQLLAYPIPHAEHSINPCYAISIAIPQTAQNPQYTLDFINFAEDNINEELIKQSNMIPAFNYQTIEQLAENYSDQATFVLRESPLGVNQISVLDFLNGKIDLAEISILWKRGFFIPEPASNI